VCPRSDARLCCRIMVECEFAETLSEKTCYSYSDLARHLEWGWRGSGIRTDQGCVDQSKPRLPQGAKEAAEGDEEIFEGAKESAAQDDQERSQEHEASSEAVLILILARGSAPVMSPQASGRWNLNSEPKLGTPKSDLNSARTLAGRGIWRLRHGKVSLRICLHVWPARGTI
jgi:hypothetical protein